MTWTEEKRTLLTELWDMRELTTDDIGERFNISGKSVRSQARRMNLPLRYGAGVQPTTWTYEMEQSLTYMWNEQDLSARAISERLNVTRNSIIGKARRLRLKARRRVNPPVPGGNARRRSARLSGGSTVRPRTRVRWTVKAPRSGQSLPPSYVLEPVPPRKARMCSLLDLGEQECKWPIGDPKNNDFGFCGASRPFGQPYCQYHQMLSYPNGYKRAIEGLAEVVT